MVIRTTFTYDPSIQVTPQRTAALNVCFPWLQSTPLAFN
ncbi:hypothetical protein C4K05_3713 [Pseudomonas chlororaphis subsp. aureofaciens]|nr:hypothetical protein C4K14_3857 [Pseudomonas chlororaphis subsp. aureofaciens]AZE43051.1 hypothetical protein C4K05_3713 [Pseudomonas chlororaphis subsp. aureofaciens]